MDRRDKVRSVQSTLYDKGYPLCSVASLVSVKCALNVDKMPGLKGTPRMFSEYLAMVSAREMREINSKCGHNLGTHALEVIADRRRRRAE